jgi:hypothetical protein
MSFQRNVFKKIIFCCENARKNCINKDFPVVVSKRYVCLELKKHNAVYVCNFCPWCCFHYYDLEELWQRDFESKYGINPDECFEVDEEFDMQHWWIEKEYFDFTSGYGELQRNKCSHKTYEHAFCCDTVYELLDQNGNDAFRTHMRFISNIRTYAILNQKEYGGFEPIDYCPFCGAKLPERLDQTLTEILQKEYGLDSWKDYKKAPEEFHTDEWWKKRRL